MANQIPDQNIPNMKSSKSLLAYVLSFIGFGSTSWQDDRSSSSSRKASVSSSLSASTLASSFSTPPSSRHSLDLDKTTSNPPNDLMDQSTVLIQPSDKRSSLYDSWRFQHWVRQLPKLGLVHLVSTTAIHDHPTLTYELLETQYTNDLKLYRPPHPHDDEDTKLLGEELDWIQSHAHAIVHQLDPLRPNQQFAQAKEITHQLDTLARLIVDHFHGHWGDSLITILALILLTQECLNATSEIRQYVFYRAKFGRTLILAMTSTIKHQKIYRGKKLDHPDNYDHNHGKVAGMTRQQQEVARRGFPESRLAWLHVLHEVCTTLARLDEHWHHRNEYSFVPTQLSILYQ